jgi:hypothetical protein
MDEGPGPFVYKDGFEVLIPMDTLIHVMIKIQSSLLDSLDHHMDLVSMDILVLVHVVIEF